MALDTPATVINRQILVKQRNIDPTARSESEKLIVTCLGGQFSFGPLESAISRQFGGLTSMLARLKTGSHTFDFSG
jgi:hypothetical protein